MYNILSVEVPPLSPAMALLSIAGIALIFYFGFRRMRKGLVPTRGTMVWAGLFVVLLAIITVFCLLGLCMTEYWMYLITTVVCTGSGILVFFRNGLLKKLITSKKREEKNKHVVSKAMIQNPSYFKNGLRIFVLLPLVSFAAMIAMEIADNPKTFMIWPGLFWLEYAMVGLVIVALYFISQRQGAGPAVGVVAFGLIGIAEHFVDRFKSAAITPSDLFALDTAAEVSGGYEFSLSTSIFITISVVALGLLFSAYLAPTGRKISAPMRIAQIVINLVVGAACITVARLRTVKKDLVS